MTATLFRDAVTEAGFQATKLASTGGFLKSGNTTFMLAVDDSRVDEIIEVIRKALKKEKADDAVKPFLRKLICQLSG